jgi:hypothetical protein
MKKKGIGYFKKGIHNVVHSRIKVLNNVDYSSFPTKSGQKITD